MDTCLSNFQRFGDSQKRMCSALTCFARQAEDEKKITGDLKSAIMQLVNKTKVDYQHCV
jgi:hypothetical protein